jgi:GNAT superfamily N-acetyltransferase
MRAYTVDDFLRIRDFLVETYAHFRRSYNWTIERWNFAISLARSMHAISLEQFAAQVGIWEDGGEIQAVVNAEGEDSGEAFFQLRRADLPASLLGELFDFCDARMGKRDEAAGTRTIRLFLPGGDARLVALAQARGYAREDWVDHDGVLEIDDVVDVSLPEGYAFADGTAVTPAEMAAVHAAAFGYADDAVYPARAVEGFRLMVATPDFRPDLSMYVCAPDGTPAAFATMWYDARNHIGILEPVGTAPAHRRQGLARAAIHMLINRIRAEDAWRVHVGSDQAFYQRLGFVIHEKYTVWQKVVA